MPRQGEFSDPAADAAHATTVLRPLLGSALMLAAWVRAILYSVWTCGPCCTCSRAPHPAHSPLLCIVCGGGGGCHFPFCALLCQLDIELLLRVAGWTGMRPHRLFFLWFTCPRVS